MIGRGRREQIARVQGMACHPILVVDDEEANRDLLARRLQRAGYPVELAANATEALEALNKQTIEMMLLDIMMPGLSGIDLLKLLRGTYSSSQLPIIMVSAVGESTHVSEALDLGANDYITKPVDFSIAMARIRSQLNQKRAEEALRESEERYALAARGTNDGLWDWDLRSNHVYFSHRWKDMLGYAEEEISSDPEEWLRRIHPDDVDAFRAQLRQLWEHAGETAFASEHRVLHRNGEYRWLLCRGMVLYDRDGTPIRAAGSITDITSSKVFDSLTGLANRTQFAEELQLAVQGKTAAVGSFAVLFIDLDRFKVINDSLGHLVGDQLLVGVAQRLRNVLRNATGSRSADLIARLGGDEFAILVGGLSGPTDARMIARRILTVLRSPFELRGKDVVTSASIGIAMSCQHYNSAVEMLRDADLAMYRAKSLGRGRSEMFDANMRAEALARLELEVDLRTALDHGQFVLHYQPLVSLETETTVGFEALLRWQHPKHGLIPPLQFVAIAEETGLILPIGKWVLERACLQLRTWQQEHPSDPPLEMSVNVSPKQLKHVDFVDTVRYAMEASGISRGSLKLEVTEGVLLDDPESVRNILTRLRDLGVGLKIDDFGTGYSSLSYLSGYPFDGLKIDKSFVLNLDEDRRNEDIIQTILGLASNMKMRCVAEGVETPSQAKRLKEMGCTIGQGYLFAKPLTPMDADRMLEEQSAKRQPSGEENGGESA